MAVAAQGAQSGIPALVGDGQYVAVNASGTALEVNPGDYVAWSGQYAIAVNTGIASWKASGIGIALDRNPAYDWAGRKIVNTALMVARRGTFVFSANFSGIPAMGTVLNPSTTGSAVGAPSGVTGVRSKWNTAAPVSVSGATAAAPVGGVAQVVGWLGNAVAGTGQLVGVLWDRNADYY